VVQKTESARNRVLDTASRLFYRTGFRAVGVDTIIAESGVAKTTLYRHFPSKDDLIVAYLERSNRQFWTWMEGLAAAHDDPRAQLEAIFDGVAELASSPRCLGCTFVGAAVEFPATVHPGHRVAAAHKVAVLERLHGLAKAAGAREPQALAEELLLLMDGAWSAARVFGSGNHARRVAQAARALIKEKTD
jgi:AcrR family transcriptional regulator